MLGALAASQSCILTGRVASASAPSSQSRSAPVKRNLTELLTNGTTVLKKPCAPIGRQPRSAKKTASALKTEKQARERQARADLLTAAVMTDGESRDGLLRRRKVSPGTQKLYQKHVEEFLQTTQLSNASGLDVVDVALDGVLVDTAMTTGELSKARNMYYAVRWHYSGSNQSLRLSYASF